MVTNEPDVEYTEVVHHRMADPTRGKHVTHLFIPFGVHLLECLPYFQTNLTFFTLSRSFLTKTRFPLLCPHSFTVDNAVPHILGGTLITYN